MRTGRTPRRLAGWLFACAVLVATFGLPRQTAAQDAENVSEAEGSSAFARRDVHDLTALGGVGWGRVTIHPDEAGGGFGAFVGSNLHLGRNGALTTRLEWFQPTWMENYQTDYQPSLAPVFSLSVGLRAQAPIGRSMLSAGLAVELYGSPPVVGPSIPEPAVSANYEYLLTEEWSVGLSYRVTGPLFVHSRIGLTVGREF